MSHTVHMPYNTTLVSRFFRKQGKVWLYFLNASSDGYRWQFLNGHTIKLHAEQKMGLRAIEALSDEELESDASAGQCSPRHRAEGCQCRQHARNYPQRHSHSAT